MKVAAISHSVATEYVNLKNSIFSPPTVCTTSLALPYIRFTFALSTSSYRIVRTFLFSAAEKSIEIALLSVAARSVSPYFAPNVRSPTIINNSLSPALFPSSRASSRSRFISSEGSLFDITSLKSIPSSLSGKRKLRQMSVTFTAVPLRYDKLIPHLGHDVNSFTVKRKNFRKKGLFPFRKQIFANYLCKCEISRKKCGYIMPRPDKEVILKI